MACRGGGERREALGPVGGGRAVAGRGAGGHDERHGMGGQRTPRSGNHSNHPTWQAPKLPAAQPAATTTPPTCRSCGMGAELSLRAFTRSGAYCSSSGAMKVMAVPLAPARPVRPTLQGSGNGGSRGRDKNQRSASGGMGAAEGRQPGSHARQAGTQGRKAHTGGRQALHPRLAQPTLSPQPEGSPCPSHLASPRELTCARSPRDGLAHRS